MVTKSDKPVPTRRPRPATAKGAAASPTSASQWKKKAVSGTLVVVPSGNQCLIRTPGMQVFLRNGVIPNGLQAFIQDAMKRGAVQDDAVAEMLNTPEKLQEISDLADQITVYCCIEPKVAPTPLDEDGDPLPLDSDDRDPEVLYVDEMDFSDKMFIFSAAVGGPTDLEKFRSES